MQRLQSCSRGPPRAPSAANGAKRGQPVPGQAQAGGASGSRWALPLRAGSGVPTVLFPGRVLQFQVKYLRATRDLEEEESYATLVRFPLDAALSGRATALINFATGAVEVEPGEDAAQVLLLRCPGGLSP